MRVLVINGPNLNLLGRREPEVYGSSTLADLEDTIEGWATALGVSAVCQQSNDEAEIIDALHDFDGDGIVINPGAFTHTSHAIADALRGIEAPAVEVHISNVKEREPWRAESVISEACVHTIFGRDVNGYRNALQHLVNRAAMPFETLPYGPHPEQVGDLRRGGDDLVVLVHGGLWRQVYARDSMEALAVDLGERGFSTWNIEYRRLGNGGGWPGSGQDVLMALEYTPQLGVDPSRVVILSHSAGSHLAMWAAERSTIPVDLHVAMGPLLDLDAIVDHDDVGAAEAGAMLAGGAPTPHPERVETALVHGVADQIVPLARSVAFAEETGCELHQPECDHFGLLNPAKPEWSSILNRIGESG